MSLTVLSWAPTCSPGEVLGEVGSAPHSGVWACMGLSLGCWSLEVTLMLQDDEGQ